jgi:hypothetical protein
MTLLIQFITGKVHVFKLHGNPDTMEPYMAFKHKVTNTLGPEWIKHRGRGRDRGRDSRQRLHRWGRFIILLIYIEQKR